MAAYIALVLSESSVNVTNNTSVVTADLYYYGNGESFNGYPSGSEAPVGQITIDGTTYSAFNKTFTTSTSAQYLGSASKTVTHKSDGSYTVSASATFNTKVSLGTLSCSKSLTLTTIPRKSSISAVSASALGSASTITVSRQSSSFTHTITYKCGSATGIVCTKSSSTSVSWTPSTSLASQNTSGTSLTVTFTIETFNGSTSLGTNTWTSYSYYIPDNSTFKPTVSLSVDDVYTYRTTYGAYVQGKSALQIGVTAAGKNSASIKSYTTTIDGKTYATSSITTSVLTGTGTLTITTNVVDSRGFTNSTTWDIEVLPYSAPKITSSSVQRTNSGGTPSASGTHLTVTYAGEYSSLNSKNTISYTVKYKKTTETNYSSPATATNGKYTFAADTASSYDIVLTATDKLESVNKVLAGPSISKFLSMLGNRGLAIGKVAELLDTLDIGWLTRIRNHLSIGNKSSGTDGKTGTFIHKDGIIYIQRDDSQGYHPYIGFLHGDETTVAAQVRSNESTRYMEFLSAQGYSFGNKMIMPNNKFFFAKDAGGTERNLLGLNDSNNLLVGWDLYDKSLGNTAVYGNQVRVNTNNGFVVDGIPVMRIKLLWSNASHTSTFTSQDVYVDFTGYDMVMIMFKQRASHEVYKSLILPFGFNGKLDSVHGGGGAIYGVYRDCYIRTNSIGFGNAWYATSGQDTADNTFMVPYRFYGLKIN